MTERQILTERRPRPTFNCRSTWMLPPRPRSIRASGFSITCWNCLHATVPSVCRSQAEGDLHVDQHHTVEDVGICLGLALREALGDKQGIRRYGHFTLPMEETLVTVAIDLSGRSFLVFQAPLPAPKIGEFDSELVEDFWQAVASHALCNLHIVLHYGRNSHHIAEAIFKAAARALRMAVDRDARVQGVPSTKGVL